MSAPSAASSNPADSPESRVGRRHSGLRGDDGTDPEKLPQRLLWVGLLAVVMSVGGGGAAIVGVYISPDWAIPVTIVTVVVCVSIVVAMLLWAIPRVQDALERATAAERAQAATGGTVVERDAGRRGTRADVRGHVSGDGSEQRADLADEPAGRAPWTEFATERGDDDVDVFGPQRLWLAGRTVEGRAGELMTKTVFVKLARRLQAFLARGIDDIDNLETTQEDPDLLDKLYGLDHQLTLARRQAENLAVLGGEAPARRSSEPVEIHAVLLAANSEIERFGQVDIIAPEAPDIQGYVAAEVIHLLAELLENATQLSDPEGPKVEVRANRVAAGVAIEVSDRGLGLDFDEMQRINRILDGTDQVDTVKRVEDGRIGLAVVRELASRHGINVCLQKNIFGGICAVVVIPPALLVEPVQALPQPHRRHLEPAAVYAPQPQPARRAQPVERTRREPSRLAAPPAPVAPTLNSPHRYAGLAGPASAPPASSSFVEDRNSMATTYREPARDGAFDGGTGTRILHGELPVRGRDVDPLAGASREAAAHGAPPPLPKRQGSHMPAELRDQPAATTVSPGHTVDLFAQIRAGRNEWPAEGEPTNGTSDWTGTQPLQDDTTTRGDGTSWTT